MQNKNKLLNKIFLTFDIDWAPDYMVEHVIELCMKYQIKATFFATHQSSILNKIKSMSNIFEIGLHPNFLPNSSQGNNETEILNYCKQLVPDVISIRTHCVFQHGGIYNALNKNFGENIVDSSICMPGLKNIEPFRLYTPSGCLIRVPFFWADDYYLLGKEVVKPNLLLEMAGCKVYMFHPIHIYINTTHYEDYETFKKEPAFLIPFDNKKGIGFIFNELLKEVKKNNLNTGLMKDFLNYQNWQDIYDY